jgi:glutamate-ammonia-ligase adenylyltransferase
MTSPTTLETIIQSLPDPDSARRFYSELSNRHSQTARLNEAILADLLTLSAYSPLLATTILQNPEYIQWLGRERSDTRVHSKEQLLESLSRFSLLHTDIAANVMLARFRRRELLRIFLRDIRRLATIAEITEELSNLADAIVEFALRLAKQDLDNRFGVPLVTDERGRETPAEFCVVALGKLGSKELNYSSDIDLLFIYSSEGTTSDTGTSGKVTNREYFIKLAEKIINIAGGQSGEGAAYRIDMRLRPHGSIGRLALSLEETVRYYETEAREWEQQVLIRSRPVAGEIELFKEFHSRVEPFVFRTDADIGSSLENVRRSKRRIEDAVPPGPGFNVKLGRGGIREIEFIAQALQLAYGGRDPWLRYPHTLVSLSRLADRGMISDQQLTDLYDAYELLRRVEHLLQMEHGLQTHTTPKNESSLLLLAKRAGFASSKDLVDELIRRTEGVQHVFERVFGSVPISSTEPQEVPTTSEAGFETVQAERRTQYERLADLSPHFAQLFSTIADATGDLDTEFSEKLLTAVSSENEFGKRLSILRRTWSHSLLGIVMSEIDDKLTIAESKHLQTRLAEASIEAALFTTREEMAVRHGVEATNLSVLALGKLGGRGVDYSSDLDLVLVYPDDAGGGDATAAETYARAVEIFVTTLSGMTRDGNLYRVDLRLRPYGSNGASSNPRSAFVEYFRRSADIWELLAFVKLRGVSGSIAAEVEQEVREIIHHRARETGREALKNETIRIRDLLEQQKGGRDRQSDIKYGPGGMLDVYFASRYLQLRDTVPDRPDDRSTISVLEILWEHGSLSQADHEVFNAGYAFLAELDHNIRLTTGRSRRLPSAPKILETIAGRMNASDTRSLLGELAIHRINIRKAFENVTRS